MTPEATQEFVPILRELAAGLHAGDGGRHLVTFKPDPAPYSSSFIHAEEWLDFNSMQTWNRTDLIYPFVTKDYNLQPVKPVLMASPIGVFGNTGVNTFTTPTGWEDALLVLEAAKKK